MKIIIFFFLISAAANLYSQQDTSLKNDRDKIGDLNESYISKGEMPGAILLPGTNVSLAIGGFIKTTAFYDTKYSVKNEIITPGAFTNSDFNDGQTYIGARSSRIYLDGRTNLAKMLIRGYIEMDFRGSPGITIRHIYLSLSDKSGSNKLLMGQYWSLAMDLQTIPEGLVEPTMSGGPFARHGQIRYTNYLNKNISVSLSLEEPNNSDIRGDSISVKNSYPDGIANIVFEPVPLLYFSATGLLRPIRYTNTADNNSSTSSGYFLGIAAVIKPDVNNKITLAAFTGKGASNYLMGSENFSGYFSDNELELQKQFGGFFALRHVWSEKLRTNAAIGSFNTDEITGDSGPQIKSSIFGFINTFYRLNKYVNIGIEWIYAEKKSYKGETLNNNRFQFGIQVF